MTEQTPNRATRRSMARKGAVAAGLAGGMTALGFVAFGPGAATASPSTAPQAAHAAAPAAAHAKAIAVKKAAGKKAAAAPTVESADDKAFAAYFGAGYDWDDAVVLAKMWNSSDPGAAKVAAGKKLLAGESLPIAAGSAPTSTSDAADPVGPFFAAGYDYDDAVTLAGTWHLATPYDAKVAASKKLAAGETLPIQP